MKQKREHEKQTVIHNGYVDDGGGGGGGGGGMVHPKGITFPSKLCMV